MRSQVTLLATALVTAMLTLSALGLLATQQRVLTHGIEEALRQRADNIERAAIQGSFGSRLPDEGDPEDSFLQLVGPDGRVVAATANAATLPPVSRPLERGARQVIETADDVPLSSGTFRVLLRRVDSPAGPHTLVVAKNLDDVHETVRILAASLAISVPVVTVLLAVLVWRLTGRVLRPVEAIRAEVAEIQGSELHRRVPSPRSDDEIARLARTMNEMLDRVEQATQLQRQFVADASHELRSPLTRIRSSLEVSLAHPKTVEQQELHRTLLADTTDLQRLVEDLLWLARAESGALGTRHEPVDLDDLVLAEARRLRLRGAVQVDVRAVSAARTLGDAYQLACLIGNLASNAERHAERCVTFALGERDGRSRLVVADDGPGIPPEHHATVFKRFTRLDEARSRDAGGSGLGLAIVDDIVRRHGGTIAISSANGGGARFVVNLPGAE